MVGPQNKKHQNQRKPNISFKTELKFFRFVSNREWKKKNNSEFFSFRYYTELLHKML